MTANASRRIVIVGGGISGLSIAVRLSQSGLPVTLLEAGALGQAASSKTQGWLYSGAWFAPRQPQLARLCHESLEQTIRFCPDCLEPATRPMIYVMTSPTTNPADWTNAWQACGLPYEKVPVNVVRDETEVPESTVRHAFRLPDRAIRSDALLQRLTAKAEYQGVDLRTESLVTALLKSGDQVHGVITARQEEIPARLVILAANVGGVGLWPKTSTTGLQTEFTRVALKTHCLAIQPNLATTPFCLVDMDGLNHIPHGQASVFGTSRWIPVQDSRDQQAIGAELERLRTLVANLYPRCRFEEHQLDEWAGTTVQAMHVDQVEPGLAPMPTVIDHEREPPCLSNLLSVFPGRASLWPQLAEATRLVVLDKLKVESPPKAMPPWAIDSAATR
jgi:glycerol-3-phosphate dehydrogenase